ncbi:MAG: protein-L-isoaspartate(D-aspartate) O-methyltransferase [Immundisolibacter sp.]|uniref:protein-L-isoaspartate(D-aspartate) O-methyltransferase n=1 Tax=Immundisolibacter sp. TaxID=1934948 RepID=UPI003EDFFB0D
MSDALRHTAGARQDSAGIGMTSQRTRDRLIDALEQMAQLDPRVLEVMRQIPRHLFMDEALASRAYENVSLPIGHGQTISHPLTVARMTSALLQGPPMRRVLEIGTGSGYQTAVLAALVPEVVSIERIAALAGRARRVLRDIGVRNVALVVGDGSRGLPDKGPYDGILVTAAPAILPSALAEQLADGGRLVAPVGDREQVLRRLTHTATGLTEERLGDANFVPLRRGRC